MRVGILGAGFIGSIHAKAYLQIPDAQIAAVGDIDRSAADRLAASVNSEACYDPERLIARSDVDAVDICLPTHLHETYVVLAAQNGKHVLCEKPVALTPESIDRMARAIEEAGVAGMVAQVVRFWPQYRVISNILKKGDIGDLQMMIATRLAQAPESNLWIRDAEKSGGALVDLHVHDIDYVYSILGKPLSVYSVGILSPKKAYDHVTTVLDYGEPKAVVESSFLLPASYPFTMSLRASGTEGCVELNYKVRGQVDQREHADSDLWLYRKNNPSPEALSFPQQDGYLSEIEYFVGCVTARQKPEIASFSEAREVFNVIAAAKKSLDARQVIRL